MSERVKVRYEIPLREAVVAEPVAGSQTRVLDRSDVAALAELMMNAYVGTIDYEGETMDEAIDEVVSWFDGTPLLDHSYGALIDDKLVSAVLVMRLDELPFIAIVMTHRDYKQRGLARFVTRTALGSLGDSGEDRVVLYITRGNTPSEELFRGLGAVPQPG